MSILKVIVMQEASIDGKLSTQAEKPLLFGDQRWSKMRGVRNIDVFKWLMEHHNVEATLEGSGSFILKNDVPGTLTSYKGNSQELYEDFLPKEVLNREGHRGWFIVVDSHGRIRWQYKNGYPGDATWIGWHLLVLVSQGTPPEYLNYLQREDIPYIITGVEHINFEEAFKKLNSLLGVNTLLSTAGGLLNGKLLEAGLVDEINIEYLPGVIGGGDKPSLFNGMNLGDEDDPAHLELLSCTSQSGGQVWVRYKVRTSEKKS